MYYQCKQRYEFRITGLVPAIVCIAIFAVVLILFGIKEAITAVAIFFILYSLFSLWIYSRTGNKSYIAACLFQLSYGFYFATHPRLSYLHILDSRLSGLILLACLASTAWLLYLFYKKNAKWKGREVFELASLSAIPERNGFTERPRHAGKTEYTKSELIGFAKFLRSNLIAMPYFEENRVVFVPVKMDDSFLYLFNPSKFRESRSWVAFDFEGNVTVNITRKDYLSYEEELAFDLLCENLGRLFINFITYYRKGEADRILYELDKLDLGLTS